MICGKFMDQIHKGLRAVVNLSVEHLREREAPTRIGYNDMAIMIAFGQSELGIPTVNSGMISTYLGKHPAVPEGARMGPDGVQRYLDILHDSTLIEAKEKLGDYQMRDDIGQILAMDAGRLKSPHIDDLFFHGFRLHSAWTLG
jgi:hypothetical protein